MSRSPFQALAPRLRDNDSGPQEHLEQRLPAFPSLPSPSSSRHEISQKFCYHHRFNTSWIKSMIASEATIQVMPETTADVAALPTEAALFPHFIPLSQPARATITPNTALFTMPVAISASPMEPIVWVQYWVQ